MPSPAASLSLGLAAGLVLLIAPGAAAQRQVAENQHLKIQNRALEPVTVRVLHSDGSLQKQQTVAAGDTYRFIFEWCNTCCGNDKERTFEVKTGSTVRATGSLHMSTKLISAGPEGGGSCDENNKMTVKDENTADAWNFSTGSENQHRTAILTVTSASS